MKRISLLLSLVLSLGLYAQKMIQTDFYGCTIGKSTKTETLANMAKLNAHVVYCNNELIALDGMFPVDGIEYNKCVTFFLNDTLVGVINTVPNDVVTELQIKALKDKYSTLSTEVWDNMLLRTLLITSSQNQFSLDTTKMWSRMDDDNAIILQNEDSVFICMYLASQRIIKGYIDAFSNSTTLQNNPNYDQANAVTSVAGCSFGDSRQNVTTAFRSKAQRELDSDAHSIIYTDVSFGGHYFKRGTLYFINNKFASCKFETEFYTWKYEEAKQTYESLCAQYDRKYSNGRHFDSDKDNLLSGYGMFQKDYENGNLPPIIISLQKSVSRGGEMFYYVVVTYFSERLNTLYDDEI